MSLLDNEKIIFKEIGIILIKWGGVRKEDGAIDVALPIASNFFSPHYNLIRFPTMETAVPF